MKIQKWHIPIASICLISGILLALNLKAQAVNYNNKTSTRNEVLADRIKNQDKANRKLEKDIGGLKKELDDLQKSQVQGQGHLKDFQNQLEKAKQMAGLSDVKGPGVVITLDDIEKNRFNGDPNDLLIHYSYILSIVNALKLANADAISVNGQRIVSNSDIECGGVIIYVNRTAMSPPYVIKAIGDPDKLEESVSKHSEYNGELKDKNYPRSIEKKDSLTIDAFKSSFTFPYTKIYKEGDK